MQWSLCGIADIAQRDFRQISDGQKQLVMLARAICQKPKVLVLDEPTSYLDIRHKLELLRILKQLANDSGISVIMSLHELDLAQKVSDAVVCVKDGVIDRIGTPDEIFSGGYTERLFGVTAGCYNEIIGVPELIKVTGEPTVFVIGGGGSGIAVYRELQRKGVAFAAGVLSENDVDLPVAKALAAEVIYDKAYEPVSDRAVSEAAEILKKCERVICCLRDFEL
jgi:iron complex transport system ATP-binding protein